MGNTLALAVELLQSISKELIYSLLTLNVQGTELSRFN